MRIQLYEDYKSFSMILKLFSDLVWSSIRLEDANEHIEKVLDISDMFNLPSVLMDQIMLMIISMTLIVAARRWIKSKPNGIITTMELLRSKFLAKYYPPSKTTRKIKEIHNFKQEGKDNGKLFKLGAITTKLDKLVHDSTKVDQLMIAIEARLDGASANSTGNVQVNAIDIKFNEAQSKSTTNITNNANILPSSGLSFVEHVCRVMKRKKCPTRDLHVVKLYVEPYIPPLPFSEWKIKDDKECQRKKCLESVNKAKINNSIVEALQKQPMCPPQILRK
nr:hypothetical protein [Tanacetum cinerariifolium]